MIKRAILGLVTVLAMTGSSILADNIRGVDINFVPIGNETVGFNYQIAQTEITYAQFLLSGVGSGDENHWVGSVGSNAPAVYVSYVEAARFCNWLTTGADTNGAYTISGGLVTDLDRTYRNAQDKLYVLPTLAEFINASYYNYDDSTYHTYANISDTQPGSGDTRYFDQTSPWLVGSGTMEQNGTYDMMGNVFEWLEGSLVKGGAYTGTVQDIRFTGQNPSIPQLQIVDTLGFRIVAIPEPGTMSLMGLSTIGLFFTRTIRRRKLLGRTLLPVRREHVCDIFDDGQLAEVSDYEGVDYVSVIIDAAKAGCMELWTVIHQSYQCVDKAFWNRMVTIHERNVARRIALRRAVRKKALDSFDAFLAMLMK